MPHSTPGSLRCIIASCPYENDLPILPPSPPCQVLALELPHLTQLNINGAAHLRVLELRCPLLLTLHMQVGGEEERVGGGDPALHTCACWSCAARCCSPRTRPLTPPHALPPPSDPSPPLAGLRPAAFFLHLGCPRGLPRTLITRPPP